MSSPAVAQTNPLPAASGPEFELKFSLPNAHAAVVLPWLHACCQPHREFPQALISSVYYDTSDWRLLNEKGASDFFKTKVRLRWYGEAASGQPRGQGFMEAKLKSGTQRRKIRVALPGKAEEWAKTPLEDAAFEPPLQELQARGLSGLQRLLPAFEIQYRRYRFVHPFSPSILCLDTEIRVSRVHHGRLRHAHPAAIPRAVLEQKGPLDRLDPVFDELMRFGLRKAAFSKYQNCFFHITGLFP